MATTPANPDEEGIAPQIAPPGAWVAHRDSVPVRFFRILRNRRWAFLITLIAVPAVIAALTLARGSDYEATTTLLLRSDVGTDTRPSDSARAANTSSGLLDLPSVAAAAARRLGESADDVEDAIEVDPRRNSDLIDVRASGDSEGQATRRANAYAAAYIAERRRRERRSLDGQIQALDATIRRLNDSGQGGSATAAAHPARRARLRALDRGRPRRGGPARHERRQPGRAET